MSALFETPPVRRDPWPGGPERTRSARAPWPAALAGLLRADDQDRHWREVAAHLCARVADTHAPWDGARLRAGQAALRLLALGPAGRDAGQEADLAALVTALVGTRRCRGCGAWLLAGGQGRYCTAGCRRPARRRRRYRARPERGLRAKGGIGDGG